MELLYHERDCDNITIDAQDPIPMADVKSIGERIRWARQQRGMTQAQVAKAAGVSTATIGNLEAGLRERPRELLALARALRVSATWLDDGRGPWEEGQESNTPDASAIELALLDDLRDLPQEDREQVLASVHAMAEKSRRHVAQVLKTMKVNVLDPRQATAPAKLPVTPQSKAEPHNGRSAQPYVVVRQAAPPAGSKPRTPAEKAGDWPNSFRGKDGTSSKPARKGRK